jgi:hypothetical protein
MGSASTRVAGTARELQTQPARQSASTGIPTRPSRLMKKRHRKSSGPRPRARITRNTGPPSVQKRQCSTKPSKLKTRFWTTT